QVRGVAVEHHVAGVGSDRGRAAESVPLPARRIDARERRDLRSYESTDGHRRSHAQDSGTHPIELQTPTTRRPPTYPDGRTCARSPSAATSRSPSPTSG